MCYNIRMAPHHAMSAKAVTASKTVSYSPLWNPRWEGWNSWDWAGTSRRVPSTVASLGFLTAWCVQSS